MYYAPVWATMGNLNRRPWKLELMTRETEPVAMEIEDDGTRTNDDGKLNYRQWSRNRSGLPKIVEGMAVVFFIGTRWAELGTQQYFSFATTTKRQCDSVM